MRKNWKGQKTILKYTIAECEKTMETEKVLNKSTNKWKVLTTDLFSLAVTVVYPCLYLYFKNINLVQFGDVVFTTLLFLLNGIVLFGLIYLFLKDKSKSFLIANLSR